MMKKMKNNERIIEELKKLIDANGLKYLTDKPYKAYTVLVNALPDDTMMAAAILMLLSSGVWDSAILLKSWDDISKKIQNDCCFNKKMSDCLADIIVTLYSADNQSEWKNKKNSGLKDFLKQGHSFRWEGFSVWDAGNGTVDCYYDADIVLTPTKEAGTNEVLLKQLKKNPFMTKEAIHKLFDKELEDYLNREFEDYCTCDDYYKPVVEDFELGSYIESWCRENGFELVSYTGDGRDDGYEPKFTRGRY